MGSNLGILSNATFDDWSGRQNDEGLKVLRLVSKRPVVVWATKCASCGAEMNVPHSKVAFQKCKSSNCGKPLRKPSKLEVERAAARERQRQEEQNAARLAQLRMSEETEGYERPTRYAPKPSPHVVMSQRERLEMRQRREETEAQERAEREAREKPIREATAKLNETHRKIAALQRQLLLDPNVRDVDFWVDPQVEGLDFLTAEGICEWNVAAFRNFAEHHPEFPITDRNLEILNNYFAKHQTLLFSTQMLEKVYERMLACGVIFDGPEPEQPVQPASGTPDYESRPQANLAAAPAKGPQMHKGVDPDTGLAHEYTTREVDRMGSEEYRRRFPTLGTVTELFAAIATERERQR